MPLIARLNGLSQSPNYKQFIQSLHPHELADESNYSFHLPLDLQGGVSNIQSRRASFAAEQMYAPSQYQQQHPFQSPPAQFDFYRNYQPQNNLVNFQSRRPSIQINSAFSLDQQQPQPQTVLELENGLLLNAGVIVSSPQLQRAYARCRAYFCADSAYSFYQELTNHVSQDGYIQKIVLNIKKLNNMFSLVKSLVLVVTKAGKFEILSMPMNSNIMLQRGDVVICDGDRGKDLVNVLDPSITLECAILVNYMKKRQHAKSISYGGTYQAHNTISNTVHDLVNGQGILDDETQFQIPTKQVLRFATTQEVENVHFKLVEELKSLKTSLLKISNQPMLNNNLTILSSEYQFDQKKLTFFYCSDQRLDFRNLIKELFKIYKTRIWLCAVPRPIGDTLGLELVNSVDVDLDQCQVDDFHVRNFRRTFQELQ